MSINKPVVIFDQGHGPHGKGTNHLGQQANGLIEAALTWETVRRVKHAIPSADGWLYLTRPTPWDTPSLGERAALANQVKAQLLVSVHYNYVSNPAPCGIETMHYPGSTKGKLAAECFQRALIRQTGARDRGLIPRGNIKVLKATRCPAVLVELGFISNPYEAALIRSEPYQEALAQGLVDGLWQALRAIGALPDTRKGTK